MPTPKKKLLQAWEANGKLAQFIEEYPIANKQDLLDKFGPDMNSREDRKWDAIVEVGNSLNLKRLNKSIDFDVNEHKISEKVAEDKKITVAQSEASYYKSLYRKAIKATSIDEIIGQAIRDSVTTHSASYTQETYI